MVRVLMVCLGNICRSPMAEGVLKHKLKERGIEATVDSCGTSNWHQGELPDKRAIETMHLKGIDITDQRSRPLTASDLTEWDYVFAMDHSNIENIEKFARENGLSSPAILLLGQNENSPVDEVPDPYFGLENGFDIVYQLIDDATEAFIEREL